jgi:large subunit ribosomal protein L22
MSHKKERNSPEQKAENKKANPHAEARYLRTSPQKARLVVDLIRGRSANEARIILRSTNKRMAPSVLKVLDSAIANAEHRSNNVDVDQLVVTKAYVNEGPRMKRIRPAPMGRAYRYQRRMAHIMVEVGRPGHEWGSE